MCDFSLKTAKSRSARTSDKLTTHDFSAGTSGFRGSSDKASGIKATAVCVLPGTEIAFSDAIRTKATNPYQASVNGETRTVGVPPKSDSRVATFIQVNKAIEQTHHDALEFPDGNIVLLTSLQPNQEAVVLTLPAAPRTSHEHEQQRRAAYV